MKNVIISFITKGLFKFHGLFRLFDCGPYSHGPEKANEKERKN